MANTYTLISSVTVGATAVATIDFSSIPATYTDLVLKMSLRTNRAGSFDYATINFNNSSADYTLRVIEGTGGAAVSFTRSTFGVNLIARADGATATANTFGNAEMYIPNYASANYKSISVDGAQEDNVVGAYIDSFAGLWSQTAAINQLTITNGTGNSYVQYSTATLYGISNA
tara:strand:- start:380 stop:898 length:519 start_codon:yes stop_codon:yes gene_type:complete